MDRQSVRPATRAKDWHKADIKAALEKRGWTLRRIAIKHNISPRAISQALHSRYPASERRIAAELGLHPMVIWPSRYDEDGNSNARRGKKRSSARRAAHGKSARRH